MPLQSFIDGTLVAINSVETILMCSVTFNRSVIKLARSWFIMRYIEPQTNFCGDINERLTSRGGKKSQVIKIDDYDAIIRCILDEF